MAAASTDCAGAERLYNLADAIHDQQSQVLGLRLQISQVRIDADDFRDACAPLLRWHASQRDTLEAALRKEQEAKRRAAEAEAQRLEDEARQAEREAQALLDVSRRLEHRSRTAPTDDNGLDDSLSRGANRTPRARDYSSRRRRGGNAQDADDSSQQPAVRAKTFQEKLQLLIDGIWFTKVPRSGVPREVRMFLSQNPHTDHWCVTWVSSKTPSISKGRHGVPRAIVPLKNAEFFQGIDHGMFEKKSVFRKRFGDRPELCWTLKGKKRSLDGVAQTKEDADMWREVISRLIDQENARAAEEREFEEEAAPHDLLYDDDYRHPYEDKARPEQRLASSSYRHHNQAHDHAASEYRRRHNDLSESQYMRRSMNSGGGGGGGVFSPKAGTSARGGSGLYSPSGRQRDNYSNNNISYNSRTRMDEREREDDHHRRSRNGGGQRDYARRSRDFEHRRQDSYRRDYR